MEAKMLGNINAIGITFAVLITLFLMLKYDKEPNRSMHAMIVKINIEKRIK